MASERRIERLNKVVSHLLAEILVREFFFEPGVLITITRVAIVPNMSVADVFFTTLPTEVNGRVLSFLNKNIFNIQQSLNKKLHIRPVPKIVFRIDKGQEKAEKVYSLLEKAKSGKKK